MAEFREMLNKFIFLLRKAGRYHQALFISNLIRTSGLFDNAWYLANNPDVAQAKTDPLFHYLLHGGFEGRDPGPHFSSNGYLDAYEDVKKAGVNPLVHYLKYGRKEGREVRPQRGDLVESLNRKSVYKDQANGYLPLISGKQKIFCIGRNKTGTTSLEQVFKDFGYKVGVQSEAELLMDDWAVRDYRRIVQYCNTADAFQDVPFSLDFTYQILDYAFPDSKFILTIRNNADEWYKSLVRFHSKLLGVNGPPTANDLKNSPYRRMGWMWRNAQYIYGVNESTLYDKEIYKAHYTNHNNQVLEYFRFRPQDLLVLNLSDASAMQSLCEFLGIKYDGRVMPHLNKSGE